MCGGFHHRSLYYYSEFYIVYNPWTLGSPENLRSAEKPIVGSQHLPDGVGLPALKPCLFISFFLEWRLKGEHSPYFRTWWGGLLVVGGWTNVFATSVFGMSKAEMLEKKSAHCLKTMSITLDVPVREKKGSLYYQSKQCTGMSQNHYALCTIFHGNLSKIITLTHLHW